MISLQPSPKVYKNGVTALDDVSVEVEKGEFVFVVGQSGSGKSTLIRLLLKEEEATKGSVYVAGKNLAKITSWNVPYLRRNIGHRLPGLQAPARTRRCSRTWRSRWRSSASRST